MYGKENHQVFFKKKYSYITMLYTYFKLVPGTVIFKVLVNTIRAIIPTVNIIITAQFLDAAVIAVADKKLSVVIFPLCLIIVINLFNFYIDILIDLINTKAENKIRKIVTPKLAEKKASIKYMYYEQQESVDLIERVTNYFEKNLQSFFEQVFSALNIIAQVFGFVLVLGTQLWWASIVFIITCIPSFLIACGFGKRKYATEKELTKIDRKAKYIFSILTGRDTIEERYIYGYTDKLNKEYEKKYEIARIARKNIERREMVSRTSTGLFVFFSGIIIISILLTSMLLWDSPETSNLTIGMFTSLVNAIIGLSQQMRWSIPKCISDFKYKLEYLKDLNKFLELDMDEDAMCQPEIYPYKLQAIEFKNVSFKYPGTSCYVLKNFSVKFESGKHYSIVGLNGVGKTTIVKLLTKLYDEYDGEILINNKELKEYSQAEIKGIISVIYQDFCHYPLSFYGNIAIGNCNSINNHLKIKNITNMLGLSEVVKKLPQKYETPITKIKEGGVDLSGGEWQRVALARLIANPAPVKILDEPTAALDPLSENKIYEQFENIINKNQKNESPSITIFISHRMASTKLADEIIVISEGRVVENGKFDELIDKEGIFASMFRNQSEWYRE